MRNYFLTIVIFLFISCIYSPGIKQTYILNKQQLTKIKIGMSINEIKFLLGKANIKDSLNGKYYYFYKIENYLKNTFHDNKNNLLPTHTLTLTFVQNKLFEISNKVIIRPKKK